MIPVSIILEYGQDISWDIIWQDDLKSNRARTIEMRAHKKHVEPELVKRNACWHADEKQVTTRAEWVARKCMPILDQDMGFWSMYDYWDAHYDPSEYEGAICSLDLVSESPKPVQQYYLGKIKQGELSALDRGLDVTVRVYNQNRYGR